MSMEQSHRSSLTSPEIHVIIDAIEMKSTGPFPLHIRQISNSPFSNSTNIIDLLRVCETLRFGGIKVAYFLV